MTDTQPHRQFRCFVTGMRPISGVLIQTGVRLDELNPTGQWVYHSTQPDLDATKSLVRNIGGVLNIMNP